jgi:DNA (cytosine-5)-methyltransferase 1
MMRIRRPVKAKQQQQQPQAVSLFAGAGGDTLGMEQAGYHVAAFSEFKAPAIETHLAAFPHSRHLTEPATPDITALTTATLQPYARPALLFAGFPCQGFSHAGKKREEDPRNELVHQFVRIAQELQPDWLIGENVPGLLSRRGRDPQTGEQRPVIEIVKGLFEAIGYRLTYRVFHATAHGVPQERKRLILVGAPAHKGYPVLPPEEEAKEPPATPTLRPFLETHLVGAVRFPAQHLPADLDPAYWIATPHAEPTGTPHPNLLRLVQGIRGLTPKEREASASSPKDRKDRPQRIVEGGLISFGVRKSPYHGQILHPDRPSKTIICTYGTCPRLFVGLHHAPTDTYWVRCLSVTELAQIQGFPKDYPWKGKEKEIITQIGNAVPPPLVRAVVEMLPRVRFQDVPHVPDAVPIDPVDDDTEE